MDDLRVLCGIFQNRGVQENFIVKEKGGYENLCKTLSVELKASGVRTVGVVVDADTNLSARWESLNAQLSNIGYQGLPNVLPSEGLVVTDASMPTLGVWMMPNNFQAGALEDFLALIAPLGDELLELANNTVDSIPPNNQRFRSSYRSKAVMHTWLSWQEDPGTPLGLAVTKQYFSNDSPHIDELIGWLERLFG